MVNLIFNFRCLHYGDMTSCYVMFNECISKLVIVCEYMVAMPNAFYESCFSNPAVKLVYLYFEILDPKNRKKKNLPRSSNGTKLLNGYK